MAENLPTEGMHDADPPTPEKLAYIRSAQYDYDGVTIVLKIVIAQDVNVVPFALSPTDPYGLAPYLRGELARMVEAGEIVIEPAPPLPVEDGELHPAYQGEPETPPA